MLHPLKWFYGLVLCACFLFVQTATVHAYDSKLTNEIDLTGALTFPNTKYQRGETLFELMISNAHYERSQGSCLGFRWGGGVAFKVIGKDEEWENSLTSRNLQASPIGTILMGESRETYISVFVNPGGGPSTIGGVPIGINANGYSKYVALKFKTNGWRSGEYTLIGYLSDGCRDFTMVTKKFTLPEIPKTQLKCEFPSSVYQEESFQVACTSSLDLVANGVLIELNEGGTWSELATEVATGKTLNFKGVQLNQLGKTELRARLVGIQDTIQDAVSDSSFVQVNPPKLNIKPFLELSKSSKEEPVQIRMVTGNNTIVATLQSASSPNGPWQEQGQIRSTESVSKDISFGNWIRVVYEGNSAINKGNSEPFQVLITPLVTCSFPSSVTSGKKFQTTCSSNQKLQAVQITLQYQDSSGNWVSISKGSMSGVKANFSYLLEGQGTQKLRIRSEGLRDFYTAFNSSVSQVKFIAAKSNSSSKSGPGSGAVPKGKVDKGSNAYKYMYNFGQNLSLNSLASDSALSQCLSAKNSGLIKVRGIPQYLGVQATQIQSYLKTASGFQGCLDGFGK